MKLIDISMPLWEGAGYGEILAFPNCPVEFTEYMFYDTTGIRRTHIKFDDESGSPFMVAWQGAPHRPEPPADALYKWRLDEIPLDRLIMRETVILDVPGPDRHQITEAEIDAAAAKADWRQGDDVLIRSGWGTLEKAYSMGIDYVPNAPSYTSAAALKVGELMEAKQSGIMIVDTGVLIPPTIQGYLWSVGPGKIVPLPRPWPSAEARERRMDGRPTIPEELGNSSGGRVMRKTIALCKCVVGLNRLKGGRTKLIMLPLLIKHGGASPCRFIAVEDV